MSAKIPLSLIIPTIGREQYLRRLFDSLCAQTRKNFEVIVVDQSEHPESIGALLESYVNRLSVKHIVQTERGAVKARNEGVLHADGEIIAWPDDDCWYEDTVVERVLEHFEVPAFSILLGCPLTEEGNLYNRRVPKIEKEVTIQDTLRFGIEWSIFIRKDALLQAGGFDPRIGAGSGTLWAAGESSDLCIRVLRSGESAFYSPLIRIHHPQSRAITSDAPQKAYSYAYGMGALSRKNAFTLKDFLLYFWSYLRAFFWAVLRLKFKDIHYQYLRISGFILGYKNFYQDAQQIQKS